MNEKELQVLDRIIMNYKDYALLKNTITNIKEKMNEDIYNTFYNTLEKESRDKIDFPFEKVLIAYKKYLLRLNYCDDDEYRSYWIKIKNEPLNKELLLLIHEYFYHDLYSNAGIFRKKEEYIDNFMFCKSEFIKETLSKLIDSFNKEPIKPSNIISFTAKYISELYAIKPFLYGNITVILEYVKEISIRNEYMFDVDKIDTSKLEKILNNNILKNTLELEDYLTEFIKALDE